MRASRALGLCVSAAIATSALSARAAESFDATTLAAVIGQNVNVMAAHQRLLRAQSVTGFQGLYYGIAGRVAPASYPMSDGTVEEGGLARNLLAVGGLFGPREFNVYGGLQLDWATASDFPNPFSPIGDNGNRGSVIAGAGELMFHAGVAFQGVSVAGGWLLQVSEYDADPAGRFIRNGYPDPNARQFRPGAPSSVTELSRTTHSTYFTNIDYDEGYSLGALIGKAKEIKETGEQTTKTTVSAIQALAQPFRLARQLGLPEAVGLPGIGLNRYAPEVDYYGDRFNDVKDAIANGGAQPPTREDAIYEIPVVSNDLGGLPVYTRLVTQVSPTPLFRLAEVGASAESPFFRAGARAMMFRRGDSYTGAFDSYAGVFVSTETMREEIKKEGGDEMEGAYGLSALLSYSFNSPDSSTFVPLPNAHVIGISVMVGLPEALPPPVPIFHDPLEKAEKKGGSR
jgi:hypothetical protein